MTPHPTPSTPPASGVGWRTIARQDRGSAAVEWVLYAPLLVMMLLFLTVCERWTDTGLRLADTAHQAARAATLARDPAQATHDATATAQTALAQAGLGCHPLAVQVDTAGLQPGTLVTVTVSCTVALRDLGLLGLPGSTTRHAQFASVVDQYRGGASTPDRPR